MFADLHHRLGRGRNATDQVEYSLGNLRAGFSVLFSLLSQGEALGLIYRPSSLAGCRTMAHRQNHKSKTPFSHRAAFADCSDPAGGKLLEGGQQTKPEKNKKAFRCTRLLDAHVLGEVKAVPIEGSIISSLGDQLYGALIEGRTVPNLRDRHPEIDIVDAYRVQERMIARRLEAGEKIIGKKIGVTSKVVQEMIGVFEPDFGQLTDRMLVPDCATADHKSLIQPKAEGEIAFILKNDLNGLDLNGLGVIAADVLEATEYVTACFEIVDSRIYDWDIRIQDTVADNASCGIFAIGTERLDPRQIDLAKMAMTIERDGAEVASEVGAAVQGSPLNSVAWLANTLGELGMPFRAGEIILSGALGPMIDISSGDTLQLNLSGGLGSCRMTFS